MTLGNIKTAIAGTDHYVSAEHAQSYLTSFAIRFNRPFQLDSIERLAGPPFTPPAALPRCHCGCVTDNQGSVLLLRRRS